MAASRPRSYLYSTIFFGAIFAMAEIFDPLHYAFGAFSTFFLLLKVFNHVKRFGTLFGLLRDISEAGLLTIAEMSRERRRSYSSRDNHNPGG